MEHARTIRPGAPGPPEAAALMPEAVAREPWLLRGAHRAASTALRIVTRALVPAYRRARPPARKVAIVVPLSSRPGLLPEEEVSMRHLCHFLGAYDKYLVAPRGTAHARDGFRSLQFPRKFFGSAAAHNRLLMWPDFYRAFADYECILIYHLDSLALSDDLLHWCEAGWDYIGAPWIPCTDTPWVKEPHVGNGGFTLMRVDSVLRVLHNRYRNRPTSYWLDVLMRNGHRLRPLIWTLEVLEHVFPRWRIVAHPLRHWRVSENPGVHGCNNDRFWSLEAATYLPSFRVATVSDGLRFAFEAGPRICFEMNQRRLPFGCHAWAAYDRAFWEPYLLSKPAP